MHRSYLSAFVLLIATFQASAAQAGMPKGLPTEVPRVLQLSTPALERFQTISFFLFIFTICAATVMFLWNYLQRDFPRLPRLTFGRAAAGVFLWGLLFVIVLTMISGARELMTPRAWEQRGYTYQIAEPPPPTAVEPTTVSSEEVGP
jgi:hypothetical protein